MIAYDGWVCSMVQVCVSAASGYNWLTMFCCRQDARVEVEKIIGRGSGFVAVEIPFTPRAKRVLELSLEEARQLGARPCLSACGNFLCHA